MLDQPRTGPGSKLAIGLRPVRDEDYQILWDVRVHRGTAKLVVVGRSGVYVIEPASWRGSVKLVRGANLGIGRQPAKKRVVDQATAVRRRLGACGIDRNPTSVISPLYATFPDGPVELRDLAIVSPDDIANWIVQRPFKLKPLEVESIAIALTPRPDYGGWAASRT